MAAVNSILRCPIGSRTLCVGTTGSGKSILAMAMLEHFPQACHMVLIDPKHELSYPGARYFSTPRELADKRGGRVRIYRPNKEHLRNKASWESIFDWIYRRKNTVLWIDELFAVCLSALNAPPSLVGIYTQGRSLNITIVACVQRPHGVPLVCITESGRYALFHVSRPEDRKTVAGCTDPALNTPVNEIAGIDGQENDGHFFWWYEKTPGFVPFVAHYTMPAKEGL